MVLHLGRPSYVGLGFSLHNQKVVGSSLRAALAATGHPLSASITGYQRPWCVVKLMVLPNATQHAALWSYRSKFFEMY